ncbi:hypothetical protein F4556_000231 [Kitasatospora gansuensis]|uniref:Uncharacterized protein n=1 Tax=Kitasatospora gansuensis TaxID=258050 RepID=A0A7W7S864_9ACTN|nr:hypothetical protein [Kitasatospora gansuensis]MBB4944696.1 hypothetical protein [Kitasatospora gansuensis]
MRLVFRCQECELHYLPPEQLRYGDGSPASPVWCSACQARMAALGIAEPAAAAAVALLVARAAAAAVELAAPRQVRPARAVRTARSGPGTRSRLH